MKDSQKKNQIHQKTPSFIKNYNFIVKGFPIRVICFEIEKKH